MKKKDDSNNSKSIILLIICIIVLILAVVGVSYAAIFYSKTGEKINRVTTGTITMSYSETTNGINLTDAYPMTDDVGKTLSQENQYFNFTVSASVGGNAIINYAVTAVKENDSTLPDNAVKVYLTSTNGGSETQILAPTKISDLEITNSNNSGAPDGQYILATGNFTETVSNNYCLRMWIANDYVLPDFTQTYKLRVNVYGNVAV